MRNILALIFTITVLSSCNSNKIDLRDYETFFIEKDTLNLNFIRFMGHDTNISFYSAELYKEMTSFDALEEKMAMDSAHIFVQKYSRTLIRTNNGEFSLISPKFHSTFSIKFNQDSIFIVDSNYGETQTYSIPSQVNIGDTFLNGNISFIKREKLSLDQDFDCLVVRWNSNSVDSLFGPQSFYFDFWIDPKYFIVKAQMVDSDNNREVLYLKKDDLDI